MRKPKQKVTDSHVERVLALDALAGILNYQDMTKKEAQAELFAMGERGEGRPNREHPLFNRWRSYAFTKGSDCYDADFRGAHEGLYPEWYVSRYDVVKQRKERFIKEQKDGKQKPQKGSHDLTLFERYTIPSSSSYDEKFIEACASIRKNWLAKKVTDGSILIQRKEELLKMILDKMPRPAKNTALGSTLCNIASKTNRRYDKQFISRLRRLSADYNLGWFRKKA